MALCLSLSRIPFEEAEVMEKQWACTPGPVDIAWAGEKPASRDFFSASDDLNESDHIRVGPFLIRGREQKLLLGVFS